MVELATKRDINQLKYIWKICFKDDDQYIDYYFDNFFYEKNVFVYRDRLKAVAMVTMIKTKLNIKNQKLNASYLYAVATLPEYQGKGIMKKLENAVCEYSKKNNINVCVLVPQTESLFNLYTKIGYKKFFYLSHKKYETNKKCNFNLNITDCSFDDFSLFRNEFLNKFDVSISHYDYTLNFIYKDLKNNGCDIIQLNYNNKSGYLVVFKKNDDLYLIESSFDYRIFDEIMPTLIDKYNVKSCFARTYSNNEQGYRNKPFGMIKFLDGRILDEDAVNIKPYMNLMLD